MRNLLYTILAFFISCTSTSDEMKSEEIPLKDYSSLANREVMVLGTFHFNKDVLNAESQESIHSLVEALTSYQPTKIFVEWELDLFEKTNERYREFLQDSLSLDDLHNEVFQLGFRLAKQLNHDSIYLFDDQTPYIGSLGAFRTDEDPFSFDLFIEYANQNDSGFFDRYLPILTENFNYNKAILDTLSISDQITVLNAPKKQEINAQRMHLLEMRIGIQKNWSGPDWLGRWYRRNVRMAANVLKLSDDGDRVLLIVGDNHKWALDELFENTPDFKVDSSWELLNQSFKDETYED